MKSTLFPFLALIALTLFFTACNQADNTKEIISMQESAAHAEAGDYSSEEDNYTEDNRKVIKTANIDLKVDHLEKAVLDLKSFLKPIKGYVYNYEINNRSYHVDQFQKNLDSTVSVEKITPAGNLSVRVPIAHADSFINYVLNSNAQIASLRINDDDITENLWEKKQVANVYAHSGKAQMRKGNSKNIGFDNNTSMNAIKAKALAAKMNYQTKYLWFDISMTAKPFYKSVTTVASKNYRTPIHIGLANALTKGWHICADIILALVTIWPILLLIGLVLFLMKRYNLRTR
jgi:hypothetical protein